MTRVMHVTYAGSWFGHKQFGWTRILKIEGAAAWHASSNGASSMSTKRHGEERLSLVDLLQVTPPLAHLLSRIPR